MSWVVESPQGVDGAYRVQASAERSGLDCPSDDHLGARSAIAEQMPDRSRRVRASVDTRSSMRLSPDDSEHVQVFLGSAHGSTTVTSVASNHCRSPVALTAGKLAECLPRWPRWWPPGRRKGEVRSEFANIGIAGSGGPVDAHEHLRSELADKTNPLINGHYQHHGPYRG
jgi:hypothetical protein